MMKLITSLTLILALVIANKLEAAELYFECSSCNSTADFITVAEDLAAKEGTSSNDVNIYNPNSEILRKFRVIHVRSFEPGVPDIKSTYELTLDNQEVSAKNNIISARREMDRFFGVYVAPEDIANSVYDVVGSSSTHNAVEGHINQDSTWLEYSTIYAGSIIGALGKVVGVYIFVEVSFNDDSKGVFRIERVSSDGTISFDIVDGVDSEGNSIPLSKEHFTALGEFVFYDSESGDNAFNEFSAAAQRFKITVNAGTGGGGGGGSSGTRFSCAPSDTGVVCTRL